MSKLKTTAKLGIGAGGALSAVCGLISDFFMPIAPYGIYLGFTGLLLLMLSLGLFFIPAADKRLEKIMGEAWYLPSFVLLSIFTISMFGFYYMGKSTPGSSGYLAGSFEELNKLQSEMLSSIEAVEINTANIDENTREIANTVKKEISEDPRKELANRGIAWNKSNLVNAIVDGDAENIQLFADGDMPLDQDSKLKILDKITGNGLNEFDLIQELYPIEIEGVLNIDYYRFFEFGIDPNNFFGTHVQSYVDELKQKNLNEYNQSVAADTERFFEDNLRYVEQLKVYLKDFLKVNSNTSTDCSVSMKTLHKENKVIQKIDDTETLKKYLNFDGYFIRSLTILEINFALNNLISSCPEVAHIQASRPVQPDQSKYVLEEKTKELFYVQEPQVKRVSISTFKFIKLVNPELYGYLISNSVHPTETDTKLHFSDGVILKVEI